VRLVVSAAKAAAALPALLQPAGGVWGEVAQPFVEAGHAMLRAL
jgi:hypothetical protein